MIIDTKHIISAFLIIAMLFFCVDTRAKHILEDEEVTIIDGVLSACTYSFSDKHIVIPDTLQGQAVVEISNREWPHVFSDKGLVSVELPISLKKVGDNVFKNNLTLDVTIPLGVRSIGNSAFSHINSFVIADSSELKTIGSYAFYNHRLDSMILPPHVISVGNNAFAGGGENFFMKLPQPYEPEFDYWQNSDGIVVNTDSIVDVRSPYFTNLSYTLTSDDVIVEKNAIVACSYDFSRKYISIPNTLDGQLVEAIKTFDFRKRDIVDIDLPGSLKTIGEYSFYYNNISTLVIPSTVKTIEESAFYTNPIDTLVFEVGSQLKTINISAFENHSLEKVILPSSLISIGKRAFYSYYEKNFSFRLPVPMAVNCDGWYDNKRNHYDGGDMVTKHQRAYYTHKTYTLTDDDVVVVNGYIVSCSYNHSRKYITIPNILDGQMVIGIDDGKSNDGVFANKSMYEVFLPNTLQYIGDSEFLDLSERYFEPLTLPSTLEVIGRQAFTSRIDSLYFEDDSQLKVIDNFAFDNHLLDTIALPNSTLAIGSYAFRSKTNDFKFTLPDPSVKEPSFRSWHDDKGNVYRPGDVVDDIRASYFTNMKYQLRDEDVVVVDGVIVSCSYDFSRKHIIIPQVLDGQVITAIDDGIVDKGVFQNKNLASLQLPSTLERIGDSEFRGEGFGTCLDTLLIPASVFTIGDKAFYGCGIDSVELQDSGLLVSIGTDAFAKNDMTSFYLPSISYEESGTWGDASENYYQFNTKVSDLSTSYAIRWSPVARFSAEPRVVVEYREVKFLDHSLNGPTSWFWLFGDGNFSQEQHPTHIYEAPGSYAVSLKVSKPVGGDVLKEDSFIVVVPQVLAIESHPQDSICAPSWEAAFAVSSNTIGARFRWQSKRKNEDWKDLIESSKYRNVTSSTLYAKDVEQTQNQEQFRAVVEYREQKDTSNIAILTVLPISTMKVYPNPVRDILKVELIDINHTIKITNPLGRLIYSSPVHQQKFSINLQDWREKGIYFIHLVNEKGETLKVEKLLLEY